MEFEAVQLDRVLTKMTSADLKLCFIDACRNNPFKKSWVSTTRQLGKEMPSIEGDGLNDQLDIPEVPSSSSNQARGYCISFAAAPGTQALDGRERNSPYAQAIVETLEQKAHESLPNFLKEVQNRVDKLTNQQQRSWVNDGSLGYFYFVKKDKPVPIPDDDDDLPRSYTERTTGVPFEMKYVEGGTFTMGDTFGEGQDDETPTHRVQLSEFWMGETEVTNAQFCAFLNAKGNQTESGETWLDIDDSDCLIEKSGSRFVPKSGYAHHPVIEVSWYGASAYCKWLTRKSSRKYRLPTEAEWEYAARGGKNGEPTKYAGSDKIDAVAWYSGNSDGKTHPVKTKAPNELGLYDMSGNVWEWCQDRYGDYSSSSQRNPKGAGSGSYRVFRGGSWRSYARYCRLSFRGRNTPTYRGNGLGFRLVLP